MRPLLSSLLSATVLLLVASTASAESPRIEMVLQRASPAGVEVSDSGRFVVETGRDQTARLWDTSSSKIVRIFRNDNAITQVQLSPDERRLLMVSFQGRISLWDTLTGERLRVLERSYGQSGRAFFTRDGHRFIAKVEEDDNYHLIDADSGNPIATYADSSNGFRVKALSPDGKSVAADCDDSVCVWEVDTGSRLVKSDRVGGNFRFTSLSFSPDGTRLVVGKESPIGCDNLFVVNAKSGALLATLYSRWGMVTDAYMLPDNKTIVGTGYNSCSRESTVPENFAVWDSAAGNRVREFGSGETFKLLADGKTLAAADGFWDLESGSRIRDWSLTAPKVDQPIVSPNGRYVLFKGKPIDLWDFDHGYRRRTVSFLAGVLDASAKGTRRLLFVDGDHLLASFDGLTWVIADLASGDVEKRFTLPAQKDEIRSAQVSPQGHYLLITHRIDGRDTCDIVDLAEGKIVKSVQWSTPWQDEFQGIAIAPDDKSFIAMNAHKSGGEIGEFRAYAIPSGEVVRTYRKFGTYLMDKLFYSPDGRYAVMKANSEWPVLLDLASGEYSTKYDDGYLDVAAFSRDGKSVIAGRLDGTAVAFDRDSGRKLQSYAGHSAGLVQIIDLPEQHRLVTTSQDGSVRVWDTASGSSLFTFIHGDDTGAWAAYTEDGYWDGSKDADRLVAMASGYQAFNVDQFALRNNRPDIVLARAGAADPALLDHFKNQYLKRLRLSGVAEGQLGTDEVPRAEITSVVRKERTAILKARCSASSSTLSSYTVYANGSALYPGVGKPASGNSVEISETIDLVGGRNVIEVSCRNARGVESPRATTRLKGDAVAGNLYFLGFGVSRYKDAQLNLKYADKDASDLADLFKKMGDGKPWGKAFVHLFTNEKVTAAKIKNAKALLKGVRPGDTVVVFVAGHGIHDTDPESTYYFLTHEADVANLAGTAAKFDLIEDLLQGLQARHKLLLIDTCESGVAEEQTESRYIAMAESNNIKARALRRERGMQRLRDGAAPGVGSARAYGLDRDRFIYNDLARRTGAIVFSSSLGNELSYESDEVQNGFFTAALLKALTEPEADADGSGYVTDTELRRFVTSYVSRLSHGLQNPAVDRDNRYAIVALPNQRTWKK